jgi:hypothetical protein
VTRLLGDAAKLIDSRSARSRQKKVGASEIGVCRRRAAYVHHGTPISNPENVTGLPAVVGTWIHKGALDTMHRLWGTLIETRVENPFLRGHVDGIDLPNGLRVAAGLDEHPEAPDVVEVDDLKTKRDARMVEYVRNRGPKRSELFQVHLYGGMLRRGEVKPIQRQAKLAAVGPLDVQRVRLRYFPRTGEENVEYPYEQDFDPDIEAEALDWVAQVNASKKPEDVPRDEDGPGLSIACDHCPFRRECWGDEDGEYAVQSQLIVNDSDLARVLAEYDEGRALEREGKALKDRARAILDATKPAIYTDDEIAFMLKWSGGNTREPAVDQDLLLERFLQMQELYRRAGLEPPQVPYREAGKSPRTISVTRWDPPEEACGKPVGAPVEYDAMDGSVWLQDRPRGGWTGVESATGEEALLTARQFAARFPDYVEPRPPCVLKKGHSGAPETCRAADFIVPLDANDTDEEDAIPA